MIKPYCRDEVEDTLVCTQVSFRCKTHNNFSAVTFLFRDQLDISVPRGSSFILSIGRVPRTPNPKDVRITPPQPRSFLPTYVSTIFDGKKVLQEKISRNRCQTDRSCEEDIKKIEVDFVIMKVSNTKKSYFLRKNDDVVDNSKM